MGSKQEGVRALHSWVCQHGGESWWEEWLPFVKPVVAVASWLDALKPKGKANMQGVKQVFSRCAGDGPIETKDLANVLRSLNCNFTEAEFELLMQTAASTESNELDIDAFLDSLMGGSSAGA